MFPSSYFNNFISRSTSLHASVKTLFSRSSGFHSLSSLHCSCDWHLKLLGGSLCYMSFMAVGGLSLFLFSVYGGLTHLDPITVATFLYLDNFYRDHFGTQECLLVLFHSDCKSGSLPTHFWEAPQCRLCLQRNMSSRICTKHLNLVSSFRSVCTWLHEARPRKILFSEAS